MNEWNAVSQPRVRSFFVVTRLVDFSASRDAKVVSRSFHYYGIEKWRSLIDHFLPYDFVSNFWRRVNLACRSCNVMYEKCIVTLLIIFTR